MPHGPDRSKGADERIMKPLLRPARSALFAPMSLAAATSRVRSRLSRAGVTSGILAIALHWAFANVLVAKAAVIITNSGESYSQNFDGLISTGSGTFVDNSTLLGWTVNSEEMDTNADEYFAGTGSSTGGEVYSFGSDGSSDRALGYVGSSGNDYFNAVLVLLNQTGGTIDAITLSYAGEQWRSGGDTSDNNNQISFAYQTATAVSIPASRDFNGWTTISSLDFTPPNPLIAAGSLDGNEAENRTTFENVEISGLNWASGDQLALRWMGNDGSGTDAGIAIDDVTVGFAAVPEPSAVVLVGVGLVCAFAVRSGRQTG